MVITITIDVPVPFAIPLMDTVKKVLETSGSAVAATASLPAPVAQPKGSGQDVGDRVRRVRARCSADLWKRIQAIAAAFQPNEAFTLKEAATRTKIDFGKVRSDWNVFGRPLKSEPGPAIFAWVPGSSPKAFTMSQAARDAILKS